VVEVEYAGHAAAFGAYKGYRNRTPLFNAVDNGYANAKDFTQWLLGAEFAIDVNHKDEEGNTALAVATRTGKPEVVTLLINKGADPTVRDNEGRLAKHKTSQADIKALLEVSPRLVFHAMRSRPCPSGSVPVGRWPMRTGPLVRGHAHGPLPPGQRGSSHFEKPRRRVGRFNGRPG
jgi:hypothetical protein